VAGSTLITRRSLLRRGGQATLALGAGSALRWALDAGAAAAAPAAPRLADRLGAYGGCVDMDNAAAFQRYIGRPLAFVHDFLPTGEDWSRLYHQDYAFSQHWTRPGSPWVERMYLSVPMLVQRDTTTVDGPGGPTTLARAAAGAYDEHYAALGRQLVSAGLGHARIRIGWEMNIVPGPAGPLANWSAGTTPHGERDFVLAYRRMVRAMRSAARQSFKFVWCPAIGSNWSPALGRPIDPERCYPGDEYVSIISCDVYDRRWAHNTSASVRWDDIRTARYGNVNCLDWFERFARRGYPRPNNDRSGRVGHGHEAAGAARPLGLGEFGTFRLPGERPGQRDGGDDPYFLYQLKAWMEHVGTRRWDHLNYWNYGAGGSITPVAHYPRWDAALADLFGGGRRRTDRRPPPRKQGRSSR
jgi:hypothetical protein